MPFVLDPDTADPGNLAFKHIEAAVSTLSFLSAGNFRLYNFRLVFLSPASRRTSHEHNQLCVWMAGTR
jgi:hypothetical protein